MAKKPTNPLSSGELELIEDEFAKAQSALEQARWLLRTSRRKFAERESRLLAKRLADLLELLDLVGRAAQARFR